MFKVYHIHLYVVSAFLLVHKPNRTRKIRTNINSYIGESKKDKTPYDMVLKKFGKEFLDTIGIKRVPNKLVVLKQII